MAEGQAIEAETWDALADVQQRKAELKLEIMKADPEGLLQRDHLRELLGALIDLEHQNLQTLRSRMTRLQAQIAGLDTSRRNLRRIKGAYVLAETETAAVFGTA